MQAKNGIATCGAVKKIGNTTCVLPHEIYNENQHCRRTPSVHPSWGIHFLFGGIRGGFRVVFGGIRGLFWGIRALGPLKVIGFSTSQALTFSGRVTLI